MVLLSLGVVGAAGASIAAVHEDQAQAAAAPAAARSAAGSRAGDTAALERLADQVVAAGAPGALLTKRTRKRTTSVARGLANRRTQRPARPGDRYRIGSNTKTMVATVILQLAAEGRVKLDDRVARWLPDLGLDRRITVRHLLQQTSGFHRDQMLWREPTSYRANRFRRFTPEEVVRTALTNPAPRPVPGTKWEYSNTNYVLAGMLIERVTHRRVEDELARRVFRPLGMRHTRFPYDTTYLIGRHLAGYIPRAITDGSQDQTPYDTTVYNMSWAWTAGAVISTAEDQATFLRGLMTGRLLPRRWLNRMLDTGKFGYGLGIVPLRSSCSPGKVVWGHDGIVFGYTSLGFVTRDGATQVVSAGNMAFDQDDKVGNAAAGALLRAFCPGQTVNRVAGPSAGR